MNNNKYQLLSPEELISLSGGAREWVTLTAQTSKPYRVETENGYEIRWQVRTIQQLRKEGVMQDKFREDQ